MAQEKLNLNDFQGERREIVVKALKRAKKENRVMIVGHDYDNQMFVDDAVDYCPLTELRGVFATVYPDGTIERGFVKQNSGSKKELEKHDMSDKKDKVSEKDGSALMGKLMEAWELDSNHSFGERKKWENKLVETLNKMGKSAKWFNENAEVIANVDTGEYDDELEKLYNVNGIDDLFSLVREIGDDTENEPVADSSSDIGNRIISALKADQGGLNNSSAGKKAQMKIVAAAENFMKKNPKVKLSNEDLENIVGGDIDEVEEKYGELKGWNKLNDAIELYFDAD